MIQRRGFLAGCMAALAAPLAWFQKPPEIPRAEGEVWYPHWRNYTFRYTRLKKEDFDAAMRAAMDRMTFIPPITERKE